MTQAVRMLLAEGAISRDQYDQAVIDQAAMGGTLCGRLVAVGAISDGELVKFLVRRFPVPHWTRGRLAAVSPPVIAVVPATLARSLRVLPLAMDDGVLTLGMTDPTAVHAKNEIAHHTKARIQPAIVSESDMTFALDLFYPVEADAGAADEDPLPLTVKVSANFAALGAPLAARPVSTPPPDEGSGAASIAEALRAIPLVNKTAARSAPRDTKSFGRPEAKARGEGKVVVLEPVLLKERAEDQGFDSWSRPASSPPVRTSSSYMIAGPHVASGEDEPARPSSGRAGGAVVRSDSKDGGPARSRHRTEGEIVAAMNDAQDRDAVVALALEHLLRFSKRAAFLVVKKNEIRGFDIAGDLTCRDAVRSFWLPTRASSTMGRVAVDKQIHLGPLGRSSADAVLSAALGGRPERVLLIPVVIQGKTVGLLFADHLDVDIPPWSRLERLAQTTSENIAKVLRRNRTP